MLNAFVLACLERVSTLEFEEKMEREGKRGINRRLEGKGKRTFSSPLPFMPFL